MPIVVGAEYRHQKLDQVSNSNPATPPSFTGVRGVPTNTFTYSATNVSFAKGAYSIKEVFGEVIVPLANNSVIGKSLALSGAFHYTDYSTSGSVQTWKVGGTYEPVDGLRARATVTRDIRAPTRLFTYSTQRSATAATVEFAGNADFADAGNQPFPMPKWRGNLELTYTQGGFTASAQERYIGGYQRSRLFVYKQNDIGAVAYTDLNLSYDIKTSGGTFQLFTTIISLIDCGYPITAIGSNPGLAISTFRSIYDVTGRYFTSGVRIRF